MLPHFLTLPPCNCTSKIANNFVGGASFENQPLDFGDEGLFDLSVMEKNRAEQCKSKMSDGNVGANQKYTDVKKIYLL